MSHVGGQLQAQFMARVRGRDPQRCLVVPIDVGKSTAAALIADHYGEVVVEPFDFALTEAGFTRLEAAIARAEAISTPGAGWGSFQGSEWAMLTSTPGRRGWWARVPGPESSRWG